MAAQVPSVAVADLQVEWIDVVGPEPAWIHGAPTGAMEVRVKVLNNGTAPSSGYRLDYHWVKNGQATWLNGADNESASFGVGGPLDDGAFRVDGLTWLLKDGQHGLGAVRVTIRPAGPDGGAGNNVDSHAMSIPTHQIAMDVVGGAQEIRSEETRFVRVRLVNHGNTAETVDLTLKGLGDAARLNGSLESTQIIVLAHSSNATPLFVHYRFTGEDDPFAAQYAIEAATGYGRSLEAVTPTFASSPEPLPPGSLATLARLDSVPLDLDPGSGLAVRLVLTNHGATSDTYLVDASPSDPGWTAAPDRSRIALNAGESVFVTVQVDALASVNKGSTSTLRVHYQSARDAVLEKHSSVLEVPLRIHGPAIRLEPAADWPSNPYVGDSINLTVRLVNHGDRATPGDATVTLQLEGTGTWREELSLPAPIVQPGQAAVLRFPLGPLHHPGAAHIDANWDAPDTGIAKQGMFHSILVHDPAFTIIVPEGLEGAPGEAVGYRTPERVISIRNDGNAEETLVLAMTAGHGAASILLDDMGVTLAPGENRSVPFEHHLPLPAGATSSVQANLTATIAGRNDLVWRANITTLINDTRPPTLNLSRPMPSVWTLGEPLPLLVEADDDSAVARVAWSHANPAGESVLHDMAPGATAGQWVGAVTFSTSGKHVIWLFAQDTSGHVTTLPLPPVNASALPAPTIHFVGDPVVEVDANHVFEIHVKDERPIASVSLRIIGPSAGEGIVKDLELDGNGSTTFDLRGAPAGPLTLIIQAQNNAGARSELTHNVSLRSAQEQVMATNEGSGKQSIPAPGALVLLALAVPAALARWIATQQQAPRGSGRARRKRVGPHSVVTLAVVLTLVLTSIFLPILPSIKPATEGLLPAGSNPSDAMETAAALDALWASFPEPLDPRTAMGPAADWLFESGDGHPQLKGPPKDAAGLFGRVMGPEMERLPIPEPPEGPEPLLAALQAYAGFAGIDLGDLMILRGQVDSLLLVPEAERALAQLVLAYTEASQIVQQALADLEPVERLLLQEDPDAVAAWFEEDPTRTQADLVNVVQQDLAARVNVDNLRAADLLVRTIEEVKDTLALPPRQASAPVSLSQAQVGAPAATVPRSSDAGTGDGVAAFDLLHRLVAATTGPGRETPIVLPPVPKEGLPDALAGLATALGVPADRIDLPPVDLPPSLADAVASIVTARRVGIESGDATVHSLLLLQATRDAEPVLRAWGALLAMDAKGGADLPVTHLAGIVEQALSPATATPSRMVSEAYGLPRPPQPPVSPTLVTLLEQHGLDPVSAAQATASLPANVAVAAATLLVATEALAATQKAAEDSLSPAHRDALQQTPHVLELVSRPQWSADEARLVTEWAQATASAQKWSTPLLEAQVAALATVEAAVATLQDPRVNAQDLLNQDEAAKKDSSGWAKAIGFIKGFQIIGTASAQPLPLPSACPTQSPLSRCDDDVWFYTPEADGILITGFGETTIGNSGTGSLTYTTVPRLIIDLGGDDVYEVAAGSAFAGSRPTSIVIDVAGDDHYRSEQLHAHGTAVGRGTLGILWDLDGNDHYEHVGDPAASGHGAQGFGANGGMGVLVDGRGQDRYHAPRAFGQGHVGGNGFSTPFAFADINDFTSALQLHTSGSGSTGILLDLGPGDDDFKADGGQGHVVGGGSLGLLINEQGRATYDTVRNDNRFQGGVANGAVGSVAGLVDMGGRGTLYSNDLPDEMILLRTHADNPRDLRQDDALWVLGSSSGALPGTATAVGFGIDSTLDNDDEDGWPNLVELVAGSDPQDPGDEPGVASLGNVVDLLIDLITNPPGVEEIPGFIDQTVASLLQTLEFEDIVFASPVFRHYDRYGPYADRICQEDEPVHLLLIGGAQNKTIAERAHILIDLGGNTTYRSEVAGPGDFCIKAQPGLEEEQGDLFFTGVGSYALDVGGNDHYDTPDMDRTQGAVAGQDFDTGQPEPVIVFEGSATDVAAATPGNAANHLRAGKTSPPVSMLLDLQGSDTYAARDRSQGSAFVHVWGTCTFFNLVGGAAWLIDLAGNDVYTSKTNSQGSVRDAGTAGLIDLVGDDTYTFDTQAIAGGLCGGGTASLRNALLFDGAGADRYNNTKPLTTSTNLEEAFERQGRAAFPVGVASALFMDLGPDFDVYTVLNTSLGYQDISDLKNNQIRTPTPGQPNYAFMDNPTYQFGPEDPDGDGASNLVEAIFMTEPRDAESHPGTVWGTPERAQNALADSGNATENGTRATGLDEGHPWVGIIISTGQPLLATSEANLRGFAIGGRGDSTYADKNYGFLVDLGGNDTYKFTGVGGSKPAFHNPQVTLVLDVGDGNDAYVPTTGDPSLGAATRGIAILADAGGHNSFDSAPPMTTGFLGFLSAGVTYNLAVTQGAATMGAVGALITWDATNRFEANVPEGGLAQGAGGQGGIGLLATFGEGDDIYISDGPGLVQGAALSRRHPNQEDYLLNEVASPPVISGYGILMDEGGDNQYIASDAYAAQGTALGSNSVGILWTGSGDDRYEAGPSSQGSGANGGVGILHDAGGDDTYAVTPTSGSAAVSHGAGQGGGIGILVDVSGDDVYAAPDATHVQGAAVGPGTYGFLLDLGGHDSYRAADEAQGYGAGVVVSLSAGNPDESFGGVQQPPNGQLVCNFTINFPIIGPTPRVCIPFPIGAGLPMGVALDSDGGLSGAGLLFDLSGRDLYEVQGSGQGASDCSGTAGAFIDAEGRDVYRHGGNKMPTDADVDPEDENDWMWTHQPPGGPEGPACGLGFGIDSEDLGEAMRQARDLFVQSEEGLEVDLEVITADQNFTVASGDTAPVARVVGNITLRAVVHGVSDPENLRRVNFYFDDAREAEGRLSHFDNETGEAVYEHEWNTTAGTFPDFEYPDRNYTLRASAFVDPAPAYTSAAGVPDLPSYDSGEFVARVDNDPFLDASLSKATLTPTGSPATLTVTIGGDLEWPVGATGAKVDADADCEGGGASEPGAFLTINATRGNIAHPVFSGYCPAGVHGFSLDGKNGTTNWADGQYDVRVAVQDARGNSANRTFSLLVDGLSPTSIITTPSIAGLDRVPSNKLRLDWEHADRPSDGSGVERVFVVQVDPVTLGVLGVYGPYDNKVEQMSEVTVSSNGQEFTFVTVAVDQAGNSESPCDPAGEEKLTFGSGEKSCYLAKAATGAKTIEIDNVAPVVNKVSVSAASVRPGAPVNFTTEISELGSGIDQVLIRFAGGSVSHLDEMEPDPSDATGKRYFYDAWGDHNQGAHSIPQEGVFFYTITAFDRAGNQDVRTGDGILDSRPPLVTFVGTRYLDGDGVVREAGGPGVKAVITVDVKDILVDRLTIDPRPLGFAVDEIVCPRGSGASTVYTCTMDMTGVADGSYQLPLNGTDKAGNHNATQSAVVVVSGHPLDITNVRVTEVRHNAFVVEWTTPESGTSAIEYGRLLWADGEAPPQRIQRIGDLTQDHRVVVSGVSPSSKYVFRAVSENAGGVQNASAFASVVTLNAYELDLSGLEGDRILRGEVPVAYTLSMRSQGDVDPVSMRVLVQDAGAHSSPVEVVPRFTQGPGDGGFLLYTTGFADGTYRVIVESDRLGDFNRTKSPVFRIDNTAPIVTPVQPRPGLAIATTRPHIEVTLLDPLGHAPPVTGTLEVRIDGAPVRVANIISDTVSLSGISRRVEFTLVENLTNGPHTLNVSVADLAGNRDWTAWPFRVDVHPPAMVGGFEVTPIPGPHATRPGGHLRVAGLLHDASTVAEAYLNMTSMNGQLVALVSVGNGRWQVEANVPADAPHGSHQLPVRAKDALDNEDVVATLTVIVDAQPPTILDASTTDTGFLNTTVRIATDEPTIIHAANGTIHSGAWGTQHTFNVHGLRPGTTQTVFLDVIDGAGHTTTAQITVTTPEDTTPPSTVGDLVAASTEEGIVALTWSAATDDSAVRQYIIQRDTAPRSAAITTNVTQTTFRDQDAPAGRAAVYRVTAADAAGLLGPATQIRVEVMALPHLLQAAITPQRGTTAEPFTFQVEYRHAGGKPADALGVRVDGTTYLLALVGAPSCHEGCLYRVQVQLPPTSQVGPTVSEAVFFANAGSQRAELVSTDVPLVMLGDGGEVFDHASGGKVDTPGPGALVLIALLAVVAAVVRSSPRSPRK